MIAAFCQKKLNPSAAAGTFVIHYPLSMAILDNKGFSSEDEFVTFYIEKCRIERPYLEENRELREEAAKLCFYQYKGKDQ